MAKIPMSLGWGFSSFSNMTPVFMLGCFWVFHHWMTIQQGTYRRVAQIPMMTYPNPMLSYT